MRKKLNKVGNSLAVRLSRRITDTLGWNEGDYLTLEIFNESIVLWKNEEIIDTKKEIISTMAATINYIIYEKENGSLSEEIEKQLLSTIHFGSSILLAEENPVPEEQCLRTIQAATDYILKNY